MVERVASRYAMEFPTQEALKKYLKEHPDADKSNHSVKTKKHPSGKRGPKVNFKKLDESMDALPDAVKTLRGQKDGTLEHRKAEDAVQKLLFDYRDHVKTMYDALDEALPKDAEKERKRAEDLLRKVDWFRSQGQFAAALKNLDPDVFDEGVKKARPIWKELQQLLGGQQVLFSES